MYYFIKQAKKYSKNLPTNPQLLRIILFNEQFCVNKKLNLVMDIFVGKESRVENRESRTWLMD